MLKTNHCIAAAVLAALVLSTPTISAEDPTKLVLEQISKMRVGSHDWPQWGGSASRNNTPEGKNIRQYGPEVFFWTVLEVVRGKVPAHAVERELTKMYKPELNTQ